jgi:hypothetical protein
VTTEQTLFFPRRLNDADAGFFFLGQRPKCNVAMLMLGVLEREIPFDSVLEELTAAGEEVPRFKDFLRRAPLDIAPPMWIPKDGFEVRAQINQASLPPGATWDDALTIVDRFQRSDFPTAAPPWEILLINGLPTGRSLLAMKVHHALSDGTALAMLFAKAFGGDFLAKSGMQVVAKMERRPETSPLVIALADRATAVRVWARRAARALPRLLGDRSVRRRERDAIRRHVRPRHRIPPGSHGPTSGAKPLATEVGAQTICIWRSWLTPCAAISLIGISMPCPFRSSCR